MATVADSTLDPASPTSPGPTPASAAKALVEHGYDTIAPAYLAWSAPRPTSTRLAHLTKLLALLPPGARVLELGCGAGVPSTQALVAHGLDVTAVDISAAQIALARAHVPQATLVHADMAALAFAPASFDAVVAFYSLFHLPGDEQGPMIARIAGWLKDGGRLLFNLTTDVGDRMMEDWMGVRMFWSGLGVDGNRDMLKRDGWALTIIEDEVAVEKVGRAEETFHWVFAEKNDQRTKAD